jgi:glycosyltransferase involved in cell wall biosynthesis
LMARQCSVLAHLGHQAVIVTGRGTALDGVKMIRIRAMDPSDNAVARSVRALEGARPTPEHPLVAGLVTRLASALRGCTDCWIHNALTVSLNPFLTSALEVLIQERTDIRWVAWTADLSSVSRYVRAIDDGAIHISSAVRDRVTWVAISRSRLQELSTALDLPPDRIQVVYPPLDILTWLQIESQTRCVIAATKLLESEPIVLVPAKALPHKCLDRALRVAAELAHRAPGFRMLITAAASPHEPHVSAHVRGELRRSIRTAGLEAAVVLLPDLLAEEPSDVTVRELMQLSDVVFLPSIEEGFGMPLLEAAACRVPVVCTDIPVFREVAGDSATYFDEEWDDQRVASLLLSASDRRENHRRRAAVLSMQRFEGDLRAVLRRTAHPNV